MQVNMSNFEILPKQTKSMKFGMNQIFKFVEIRNVGFSSDKNMEVHTYTLKRLELYLFIIVHKVAQGLHFTGCDSIDLSFVNILSHYSFSAKPSE